MSSPSIIAFEKLEKECVKNVTALPLDKPKNSLLFIAPNQQSDGQAPCMVFGAINWFNVSNIVNLRFALSYKARYDVLFIVTYPRSGRTWMKIVVYFLLTNVKSFDAERNDFFQRQVFLEFDGEQAIVDARRLVALKTHFPMDRVPYHSQVTYVIGIPKDIHLLYCTFYDTWGSTRRLSFE